jgi:carboxyl-terminal processing protease
MMPFRTLPSFLIATLLLAATPAQDVSSEQKAKLLSGVEDVLINRAFVPGVALDKWPANLERHRSKIDAAQKADDFVRAVNSALREFGISHMNMRTPSAEKRRITHQRVDLGLRVQLGKAALAVLEVTPDGQAAKQGIGAGDNIVAIDGRAPEKLDDLDGPDGSHVVLSIKKSEGASFEVELVRKVVSTDRPDTLTWLDDSTAVLRIHSFEKGYKRPDIEKLCEEAGKARYLLLDLRGNGGGATANLRHLLGMFLPTSSWIGTFVSREAGRAYAAAHGEEATNAFALAQWWDRKFRTDPRVTPKITARVAVLVNRGSASASEITAAALREVLDAPLVGSQTAGAVLASTFAKLEGGFGLQFPVSDYVSARGVRLEHTPLIPDLIVGGQRPASRPASGASRPQPEPAPTPEALAADPVVKQALALIQKREPRPAPSPQSRPSSAPRQEPGQGGPASRPGSRRGRRRGGEPMPV